MNALQAGRVDSASGEVASSWLNRDTLAAPSSNTSFADYPAAAQPATGVTPHAGYLWMEVWQFLDAAAMSRSSTYTGQVSPAPGFEPGSSAPDTWTFTMMAAGRLAGSASCPAATVAASVSRPLTACRRFWMVFSPA